MKLSIIIPAKNESHGLAKLLPELRKYHPEFEIIVVDDGSDDDTGSVCRKNEVTLITHPYSMGNGAAIKSGVRKASTEILIFMDADGQHSPKDVGALIRKIEEGFDMVVGARSSSSQASVGRLCANTFYNWFATFMVGQKVEDLTSGFRAVKAEYFRELLYLLPNGFSYPTTCTMAFFRSGYSVGYVPIETNDRIGKSHIKLFKDGVRFLLILFRIGTLYSPLKIFFPTSFAIFSTGVAYYLYTYLVATRFTNMSVSLFIASVIIFLIGLVSEQITMLLYQKQDK